MSPTRLRLILGAITLMACAAIVWRLGTSGMTSYRWSTNFERGKSLLEEGSYGEATAALETALFALRDLGSEHAQYDATLNLLADAYEGSGRFDDAYPLHLEGLQRAREHHGSDSAEVAHSLYELGRIRQIQGQNEVAIGVLRQALVIWQNVHGNEHPDLIPTLFRLGKALLESGDPAQAAEHLEWAVGLQQREGGSESPELAPLEIAYADALEQLNRKELAGQFRNHAAAILSRLATPDAETIASTPGPSQPAKAVAEEGTGATTDSAAGAELPPPAPTTSPDSIP